jgi:ATP-dependent DNA helicase RecQ
VRAREGEDVAAEAQRLLGLAELRPGQAEAMAAVLAGRDVLAVMPTGSGKSAVYQVAGALLEGPTVVVSPLIALQHDQVERIGDELGGAVLVNSTRSDGSNRDALDGAADGDTEFVFLAPEQLTNEATVGRLRQARPSLFVVDEAHCISSWGHDFRPDYRRLGAVVESVGRPPLLALTATAAPPVRRDIVEQLGMRDPAVVVAGFERPNLHLGVEHVPDPAAVDAALLEAAGQERGTILVYTATRDDTERLAELLADRRRPALAYHGGLSRRDREAVHERFAADEPCVVIATTAFGMGIDVPHVRMVVHTEPPESLDAYLQEVGRAGRDGAPARGLLLHPREGGDRRRFTGGVAEIPVAEVARVAEAVASCPEGVAVVDLEAVVDVTSTLLHQVLDLLDRVDAVDVDDATARWTGHGDVDALAGDAAALRAAEREVARTRRDMVDRYLDADGCRWQLLLGYFGEVAEGPCGHCDGCDQAGSGAGGPPADPGVADEGRPYPLGARVAHADFGAGQVVAYEDDVVTVLFDDAGYRALAVELVIERQLLRPA